MITENTNTKKRPELYEMLAEIDKAESRDDRVELIKKFGKQYQAFNDYLRCVFDETIEFALPSGRPPYTPAGDRHPTSWHKEHLKLKHFVRGLGADNLNAIKREQMFINILEAIHAEDALHISLISEKKCLVEGLTADLVEESLPGLIKKF